MQASRTMLLHLLLTFTLMISCLLKQFIMLLTSPAWKQNYLPLNMVSIKLCASIIFPRSSSFDPSVHLFQVQSTTVLSDLHYFFNCYTNNSIKFWECPSYLKWHLHNEVNKETKMFKLLPLYPCKNS